MPSPRLLLAALVMTLVGLVSGVFVAPPAGATSSLLCKGFTACANAGYSSYGYGPTEYKKMWWRMYAGHNCTNYVAYRMVRAGMSAERPWSGSGDARNWGVVFASKTNQNPMIGSVAWWSSNHVAYVQRIIDADTIVISEDHYGGDFDWRKITRAGGGWPTGFIHLADETLVAKYPPKVVGAAQVDQTLTARPGLWSATNLTFAYQWNADGLPIAGATDTTYEPTPTQVGNEFTVKVVASKTGFRKGSSASAKTPPAAPGVMTTDAVPTISGFAKVGAVLSATEAAFTPAADASDYFWFADGAMLKGATGPALTLTADHLGKKISVVAKATRAGYVTAVARSTQTAPIGPEKLSVTAEPSIAGTPYIGREFKVAPGAISPSEVTTKYQWYADDVKIDGANSAGYIPTIAEMSKRLKVGIAYSKPGYTTVTRILEAAKLAKAYPRIYVDSRAKNSVTVVIRADGIPVVAGRVTVTGPAGETVTKELKDGMTSVTAVWLKSGSLKLKVSYLGTYRIESRTRTAYITIK